MLKALPEVELTNKNRERLFPDGLPVINSYPGAIRRIFAAQEDDKSAPEKIRFLSALAERKNVGAKEDPGYEPEIGLRNQQFREETMYEIQLATTECFSETEQAKYQERRDIALADLAEDESRLHTLDQRITSLQNSNPDRLNEELSAQTRVLKGERDLLQKTISRKKMVFERTLGQLF